MNMVMMMKPYPLNLYQNLIKEYQSNHYYHNVDQDPLNDCLMNHVMFHILFEKTTKKEF
jgi:hypothetical protein